MKAIQSGRPVDVSEIELCSRDAAVIVGDDEAALLHLWRAKRGEAEPARPSLAVEISKGAEESHRRLYERETGRRVLAGGRVIHPTHHWVVADLNGRFESGAIFVAELAFGSRADAEGLDFSARVQHEMLVSGAKFAALSILTGDGGWFEAVVRADPLYQHLLLQAEKLFWRSVTTGEPPVPFDLSPNSAIWTLSGPSSGKFQPSKENGDAQNQ